MNICTYPKFTFSFIKSKQADLLAHFNKLISEDDDYSVSYSTYDFHHVFKEDVRNPHITSSVGFYRAVFINYNDGFIMLSNLNDGWFTLCNNIAFNLKTYFYLFTIDEVEDKNTKNSMLFSDYSGDFEITRCVYSMMDDKWVFSQKGRALWFENINYYKRRKIKDRLNKNILLEYCYKIGINICDDILNQMESIVFERKFR